MLSALIKTLCATAILLQDIPTASTQLTESETTITLQALNTARDTVLYGASFDLQWSSDLQFAAQSYIDSASSDDMPIQDYNNLIAGLPYSISYYNGNSGDIQQAINSWIDGGKTYNISTGQCSNNCNNYLSLIYAYSVSVGCGISADSSRFICYYSIPNIYHTLPYIPATSADTQGTQCQSSSSGVCYNRYIDEINGKNTWMTNINKQRALVTPAPTEMQPLQWNDVISTYAQSLVEQCITTAVDVVGIYGNV